MPTSLCNGKKYEQQSKLSLFHRQTLNTSLHELRIIPTISLKFIWMHSISISSPHSRIAWYDSPRKNANSFKISSNVKSWSGPQMLKMNVQNQISGFLFERWRWQQQQRQKNNEQFVYESAISWILSLFFDSQITTDGKLVVQSR